MIFEKPVLSGQCLYCNLQGTNVKKVLLDFIYGCVIILNVGR